MRWVALPCVFLLALSPCALAQERTTAGEPATRAEALERLRAEREQHLTTEQRATIERALFYVEDHRIIERLNPPEGFYPVLGSFVRGGGFGFGAGFRNLFAGNRLRVDTSAAWTYKQYVNAQVALSAPQVGGRPVDLTAGARQYDFPQEDYFGMGPATSRVDRVSFGLRGLDTFAQATARLPRWLVTRARAGVHRYDVGRGEDPRFPSLEETFTDQRAPGLADAPTLRYAEIALGVDTRDQPGNTRGGGLYNVTVGAFRDGVSGGFDFNRVDVKAMHVIPIFDKKRGIALHAAASRIDPVTGSRVPFFLMPTVGGADSLRGFREFRFRDAAAVTLNAEYRWEAFSGLDLALFVDAGDVGPTWRSLVGADLKSSWGVGFRFNTNRLVFMRLDVAGGREGPRIWMAMGPVFRR